MHDNATNLIVTRYCPYIDDMISYCPALADTTLCHITLLILDIKLLTTAFV